MNEQSFIEGGALNSFGVDYNYEGKNFMPNMSYLLPGTSIDNLIENNIQEFGKLMNESHLSYSKDFEASTLDVDLIVQRSVECGALGARLTGGGFGGFTVSLIERNNFSNWYSKILNFYPAEKIFEVN